MYRNFLLLAKMEFHLGKRLQASPGKEGQERLVGISGEGPTTTLSYEGTSTGNRLFILLFENIVHAYDAS